MLDNMQEEHCTALMMGCIPLRGRRSARQSPWGIEFSVQEKRKCSEKIAISILEKKGVNMPLQTATVKMHAVYVIKHRLHVVCKRGVQSAAYILVLLLQLPPTRIKYDLLKHNAVYFEVLCAFFDATHVEELLIILSVEAKSRKL